MTPRTARNTSTRKSGVRKNAATNRTNGTPASPNTPPSTRQAPGTIRRASVPPTVHCMLAPMNAEAMLLPTNVIAEVIEYSPPEALPDMPDWFLGQIEWENRQIPVFSYSALITGENPGAITPRARIMIIKSLSDSARVPYLGVLISDIPRLIHVEPDQLEHINDDRKSMGVFSHVSVQDQLAVIPDLERLTHLVTHTAYGALPITQL